MHERILANDKGRVGRQKKPRRMLVSVLRAAPVEGARNLESGLGWKDPVGQRGKDHVKSQHSKTLQFTSSCVCPSMIRCACDAWQGT